MCTTNGNPRGSLKIPKGFYQHIIGDFPHKIILGSTIGDTWRVVSVSLLFIDREWDEFVEENNIAEGDTMFSTYNMGSRWMQQFLKIVDAKNHCTH
jgi:hypothetical protein